MQREYTSFPWEILILWYMKNGRHTLEWRDYTMDDELLAYRVWLSEIFLQQTQVERVRGYFMKILEKYPTVQDLSGASYDEFFPYYQGMGYYSRARNLLATARIISDEYRGIFPRDRSLLMKLPGVGGYTSSAILAFAYGEPCLAWDTNLEKVFARYYHGSKTDRLTEVEKEEIETDFRNFIARHCDEGSNPENIKRIPTNDWIASSLAMTEQDTVRAINNALMDFAATVDLKNPDTIDWINYPLQSGRFYETRGSLEPKEMKKSQSFPTPDATVIVILHKDHKIYYSPPHPLASSPSEKAYSPDTPSPVGEGWGEVYSPFILPPPLHRDIRKYVQECFRRTYGLELSVRPPHNKWLGDDGKPYIAVNAQVQAGSFVFREYSKIQYRAYEDKKK